MPDTTAAESEYTPTLDELREGWQKFSAWKRVPTSGAVASGAEFDRFIERVRAEARTEIVEAIRAAAPGPDAALYFLGGDGPFTDRGIAAYGEGWRDAFDTASEAAIRAGGTR